LTKNSKKAKTAGLEQHRQALRAKKMKRKERALPFLQNIGKNRL